MMVLRVLELDKLFYDTYVVKAAAKAFEHSEYIIQK